MSPGRDSNPRVLSELALSSYAPSGCTVLQTVELTASLPGLVHCRGIEPRTHAWQARAFPLRQQCVRVVTVLHRPSQFWRLTCSLERDPCDGSSSLSKGTDLARGATQVPSLHELLVLFRKLGEVLPHRLTFLRGRYLDESMVGHVELHESPLWSDGSFIVVRHSRNSSISRLTPPPLWITSA